MRIRGALGAAHVEFDGGLRCEIVHRDASHRIAARNPAQEGRSKCFTASRGKVVEEKQAVKFSSKLRFQRRIHGERNGRPPRRTCRNQNTDEPLLPNPHLHCTIHRKDLLSSSILPAHQPRRARPSLRPLHAQSSLCSDNFPQRRDCKRGGCWLRLSLLPRCFRLVINR